jgi:hypothetical protein
MRICRVCLINKPLDEYPNHSVYKDGKETKCKTCLSEYRKAKWQDNLEASRNYGRKYKAKNRELISQKHKEYVLNNPEKRKQTMKEYRQRTKPLQAYYARKRQASILNRTPKWLTKDDLWLIKEAYELAALRTKIFGFKWHVDHIIPLQGKTVSGLHMIENLQVIPEKHNLSKHNKFEVSL